MTCAAPESGLIEAAGEVLDVVDPEDRVVGAVARGEVHASGLMHRTVHVLVVNSRGAVLIQRRALGKDCDPGLWDTSAAGHVGRGECYEAAAARELREELGLEAAGLEQFCRLPADARTGFEFVNAYLCTTDQEPLPDAGEIAEIAWYRPADLTASMAREPHRYTESVKLIFTAYLESNLHGCGLP